MVKYITFNHAIDAPVFWALVYDFLEHKKWFLYGVVKDHIFSRLMLMANDNKKYLLETNISIYIGLAQLGTIF